MAISVFDLFKIGIGPSSSHTVGPMLAARAFACLLDQGNQMPRVAKIRIILYGSLALTGRGHGTPKAVLLGLEGARPDQIDPDNIPAILARIREQKRVRLLDRHSIEFLEADDLEFRYRETLPDHPNGLRFEAFDAQNKVVLQQDYYSVGGGFVVTRQEAERNRLVEDGASLPFPFQSGEELLARCSENQRSIAQLMMANEQSWRNEPEVRAGLIRVWEAMRQCVQRGCRHEGILPGGLRLARRAPGHFRELQSRSSLHGGDPLAAMDWVNVYALAVNEENAAGGRVVTAPTNGAAGIIPAVLHYYRDFIPNATDEGIIEFLLTAGAIGVLYKLNASISGAEVGCQGEVGVACSMAAAGLTAALGGSVAQVENAAEIGMEHNLGLTCDPVGGLVQIPCIERNAMGAIKAINAQRLALQGDGSHRVSLDKVIKTMRETGADMKSIYKETSRGGLAVNVTEC